MGDVISIIRINDVGYSMKFIDHLFILYNYSVHGREISAKLALSIKCMTKVFLIGYMAVGKTTIGKRLANALEIPFVDLDSEIVQRESRSINDIFEQAGEPYFRKLESEILSEFCQNGQDMILSTGGGAPIYGSNLERMLESGTVVWLDMDLEMIKNRLLLSNKRP